MAYIVNKQLKNQNECRPLKLILALPTWGQKCIVSQLLAKLAQLLKMEVGHPVEYYFKKQPKPSETIYLGTQDRTN